VLIKPLVFCIKRRDADVYNSHFSYGPVAAAGFDEDGSKRLDWYFIAVELHLTGAFENEVDFGQFFMIMHPRVLLDIDDVHCGSGITRYGKRPFGEAAGTFDLSNIAETCYHIVCHMLPFQSFGPAVCKLKTVELSIESLYILPDVCDFIKI
jgi:hypothetical protein